MAHDFKKLQKKQFPRTLEKTSAEAQFWKQFKFPSLVKQFGAVTNVEFSPVAPHNFAVTSSTRVQIYSSSTRKVLKTFSRFKDVAYSGSFRHDGKLLVAGGEIPLVHIFDISSRAILRTLKGHEGPVHVTKFAQDNLHVFSSSDDKTVRYWDIPTEQEILNMGAHTDYVRCGSTIAQSPALWVSGGYDHKVHIWDTRNGKAVVTVDHGHPVEAVLPFPSSSLLFTAGANNEIKVWDILTGGKLQRTISTHQKSITTLSFNEDHTRLISGSLDQHLKIHELSDYSVLNTIKYNAPILCSALSPDNTHLVTGLSDGMLSIRHRPIKMKERAQSKTRKSAFNKSSHKTFMRSQSARSSVSDFHVERERKKKLNEHDKLLRMFEYKKALDAVIRAGEENMVYAMFEELIHRSGLERSLSGRDDKSLAPILVYLTQHINKPRYSDLLIKVSHTVLNIYGQKVGESDIIDKLLLRLQQKVNEEVYFQEQTMRLLGCLDMLINNFTVTPAQS